MNTFQNTHDAIIVNGGAKFTNNNNKKERELEEGEEEEGEEEEGEEEEGEVEEGEEEEEEEYDDEENDEDGETRNKIDLELGDIIQIIAPTNLELNEKTFYIYYLDKSKLKLIELSSTKKEELAIDQETFAFREETITEIYLLSRSDVAGYARQNNLFTEQWVDIHFGGDIPAIITGRITNLEEDCIEITTFPEKQIIYIDFEYKGIPEDLPIEKIIKRDAPRENIHIINSMEKEEEGIYLEDRQFLENSDTPPSMEYNSNGELIINTPPEVSTLEENVREQLHGMYLNANDLFGSNEEEIYQMVEIPDSEKKYGLDIQLNDLTERILSTIPNFQRTPAVMFQLNKFIHRFRELREKFSFFDKNYNVEEKRVNGFLYKPVIDRISNLDTKLQWAIPVVKQKKKVYFESNKENHLNEENDILLVNQLNEYLDLNTRIESYNPDLNMQPYVSPIQLNQLICHQRNVIADIEAIISNDESYNSHACCSQNTHDYLSNIQHGIQRYITEDNCSTLSYNTTNPTNFAKRYLERIEDADRNKKNDSLSIKSILILPKPVIEYSRIHLPMTNILQRCHLHQVPFLLSYILKSFPYIQHVITDVKNVRKFNENAFITSNTIQEFILDHNVVSKILSNKRDENKFFEDFLQCIFPLNDNILSMIEKENHSLNTARIYSRKFSFHDYINELEPFSMYADNVSFKLYNRIRKIIATNILEYKKELDLNSKSYSKYLHHNFNIPPNENGRHIISLLKENDQLYKTFLEYISPMGFTNTSKSQEKIYPGESSLLDFIISFDYGILFYKMISILMISLLPPEQLFQGIEQTPMIEDMSKDEKIKSKDCVRRFLTKTYRSIHELQMDNNKDDVFYDNEFDDTPYSILEKYKDQKKKMNMEEFTEFLKENLIQKHDCPPNMVVEMTETLLNKKKRVQNGEYAVLKLVPSLNKGLNFDKMTAKQKEEMEIEKKIKTIQVYYRRVKNNWIKDTDIDPNDFFDTNTFFCNVSKDCHKNTKTQTCDSTDTSVRIQKRNAEKELYKSFDQRFTKTIEEMKMDLQKDVEDAFKHQKRIAVLNDFLKNRTNNIAYELGKYANLDVGMISPYASLRDKIFAQTDFIKKQNDICMFYSNFCREPLAEGEDKHWFYCKETNIKLLPQSIYFLASEFVKGGDYSIKLSEICRFYGKMSDDGDSIVDKYSGYVLRKIDFVGEEFEGQSGGIPFVEEIDIQKEVEDVFRNVEKIEEQKKKELPKIYEDPTTQIIYNILHVLCQNIGLKEIYIQAFTMRYSTEKIHQILMSEEKYKRQLEISRKKQAATGVKKREISYETFKHQTIITMVSSVLFIAIQTSIPSVKILQHFPTCVKSFDGFPFTGEEDTTGIKYLSCIIENIKSSITPWDAVQKIKSTIMEKIMMKMIKEQMLIDPEIQEMYKQKKECPEKNDEIPAEIRMTKWVHFMPPILKISGVAGSLPGISNEFNEETTDLLKKGDMKQHSHILVYSVKNRLNTIAIFEIINDIVRNKTALLKTVNKIPFLENACCNENDLTNPLHYFMKEEDKMIHLYLMRSIKNIRIQRNIRTLSKPFLFYNPEYTKWKEPDVPNEYIEDNIYRAFIYYCNLDNNRPIPTPLKRILQEKIAGYNPSMSIEDKIYLFKRHGKQFGVNHLHQIMNIVYKENQLKPSVKKTATGIDIIYEHLEHLKDKQHPVFSKLFCSRLMTVLEQYRENPLQNINYSNDDSNIQSSAAEKEFIGSTRNLRNYLLETNQKMIDTIIDYLNRYAKNTPQNEIDNIEYFIQHLIEWKNETVIQKSPGMINGKLYDENQYTIIQFIKNAIYQMVQNMPSSIINNSVFISGKSKSYIPTHAWALSTKHVENITSFIKEDVEMFRTFQNQPVLKSIFEQIQRIGYDINIFMENIPIETESSNSQFHLFSKNTSILLFYHIWLSVLYCYIEYTVNPVTQTKNRQYQQSLQRKQRKDDDDDLLHAIVKSSRNKKEKPAGGFQETKTGEINPIEREDNQPDDEIRRGNQTEIKQLIGQLLLSFMKSQDDTKTITNKQYQDISKMVTMLKTNEKNEITKKFENMSDDDRKVQDLLKRFKMNEWNIGTQRGIFEYDKNIWDVQQNASIQRLRGELSSKNDSGSFSNTEILQNNPFETDIEDVGKEVIVEEGYNDFEELGEDFYDNVGGDEEYIRSDYL